MRTLLAAGLMLVALPAFADQTAVYTGCIQKSNGSLYNVQEGTVPTQPCKAKDKQISWNMAGQPGPQGPPGTSIPQYLQRTVDCGQPGASINAALAEQADRLLVAVKGTCVEQVDINRDDVTLQGVVGTDPTIQAPAGVGSAILIKLGAQRVRLQNLLVTGGTFPLNANNGASLYANKLTISGGTGCGLVIGHGTTAEVVDSEISHNHDGVCASGPLMLSKSQVIDNDRHGLLVAGTADLSGTKVARNGQVGVYVRNGSSVGTGASWPDGVTTEILGNRIGVALEASHLFMDETSVSGNGSAISVRWGSVASLEKVTIEGTVVLQDGSVVTLGNTGVIDGGSEAGIALYDTSTARVWGSVTGLPYGVTCVLPPHALLADPVPSGVTTNCPIGP